MIFSSSEFFYFFIPVWLAYLLFPLRAQNLLLLAASYWFYSAWDARFLGLIVLSTLVDYLAAQRIGAAHERGDSHIARRWMWLSIGSNLSILGFFKYFNFFADSLQALFASFGVELGPTTLQVILPVGISFYTFQTMGYSIDVYRRRQSPCRNILNFALFVAFFPQLMAGPIERARKLIPQLESARHVTFEDMRYGTWLVLWGLFKKVFIGDNLFYYSDWIWGSGFNSATGIEVWLGAIAFTAALYCDFSGYSDMARGLARLLGIRLSVNFNLPFWSTNPSEFWRRWHITLMSWLRDYVYASLGGAKKGKLRAALNLVIVFSLSGLWHGADWKFVIWGTGWGIVAAGHAFLQRATRKSSSRGFLSRAGGTSFVLFTWFMIGTFFVSSSATQAIQALQKMLTDFSVSSHTSLDTIGILFYLSPLILMELWQHRTRHLDIVLTQPLATRFVIYALLLSLLFMGGVPIDRENAYFQF